MVVDETERPCLSDLARFFSPHIIRGIVRSRTSEFISSVVRESGLKDVIGASPTFETVFESVYDLLIKAYRCEYIFKNEIAQRLLADRHDHPMGVYYEFRIGGRLADVAVFNGTSTAYEIKTGLDNLDRLEDQIDAFIRAFNHVYVVTEDGMRDSVVAQIPGSVGVILMSDSGELTEDRPSQSHDSRFEPGNAFATFVTAEYEAVVREQFGSLPDVESWRQYDVCKEMFCTLRKSKSSQLFQSILMNRSTGASQSAARRAPRSLTAAVLSSRFSKNESDALPTALASVVY